MRTISVPLAPDVALDRLLHDVRAMVRHLVSVALSGNHRSAIALRNETKGWFARSWRSRYAAHWHHSACSMTVGICRSYWRLKRKFPHTTRPPTPDRLVARPDQELTRIRHAELRVTTRPGSYLAFPIDLAKRHRKWAEYSRYKLGEVTLLPRHAQLLFQVPERGKVTSRESVGVDLNLRFATVLSSDPDGPRTVVNYAPLAQLQGRMQRKREGIQKAIPTNLRQQREVGRKYRRRERNRTLDYVRKVAAPGLVAAAEGRNIVFEDLSKATEECVSTAKSRDLRRRTSRWAHGLLQREVEQRSPATVIRVNPRGTSSECPRCGGPVSHPEWRSSRCGACQETFDRDIGASGIILMRGHRLLWGDPFPPKARASLAERCAVAPEGLTARSEEAGRPESGRISTDG